jgi:hypothetical protein
MREQVRGRIQRLHDLHFGPSARLAADRRDGFAQHVQIRIHLKMIQSKPFSCAPNTLLDLIGNKEYAVFFAQFGKRLHITLGRTISPASPAMGSMNTAAISSHGIECLNAYCSSPRHFQFAGILLLAKLARAQQGYWK